MDSTNSYLKIHWKKNIGHRATFKATDPVSRGILRHLSLWRILSQRPIYGLFQLLCIGIP